MNRRSFLRRGLVASAVAVAIPKPALADHIVEPTAPISEVTLEVYSYPNFATRLVKCDGTEILRNLDGSLAKDARIETFVDSPARALGNPSEHYNETLTLFVVERLGRSNEVEKYQWRVSWNHSNIGPHARGGVGDNGPESSQNSQLLSLYPPGTVLRVRSDVVTLESGQKLTAECTFKVG